MHDKAIRYYPNNLVSEAKYNFVSLYTMTVQKFPEL